MPETTAERLARNRLEGELLGRQLRAELEAARAHAALLQEQTVDAEENAKAMARAAARARRHRTLMPGETSGPLRPLGDGMT